MLGKLDDYFRFNAAAVSLRSQRQQVIASNIANADTPNFKARDVDFASALSAVMTRTTPPAGVLATSDTRHVAVATPSADTLADGTPLLYRVPRQGSADGNTVDMDAERNAFADNGLRYEAGVTMINMQIRSMLTAVQGGQ